MIVEKIIEKVVEVEKLVYEERIIEKIVEVPANLAAIEQAQLPPPKVPKPYSLQPKA
jgi:hypothetical protein